MTFDRFVKKWVAIKSWRTYFQGVLILVCIAISVETLWNLSLQKIDAIVIAAASRDVAVSGRKFESLEVQYRYTINETVFQSSRMSVSPISEEVWGHFRYAEAKSYVREHQPGTTVSVFVSRLNPRLSGIFNDGLLGSLWLFSFWLAVPLSNMLGMLRKK